MVQHQIYDVIVIGGGAAGFFGAVNAASLKPGLRVLILEKSQKLLAKVAVSGGGRCNITHHCFDADELVTYYPRGGKELLQAFHRFQPKDTVLWFERRGLKIKTESDGRMFPVTDRSQSVIDTLTHEAAKHEVEIRTGVAVSSVTKQPDGFIITAGHEQWHCRKLLLACGGFSKPGAYSFIEALGINIIPPVPSLFTFIVRNAGLNALSGISVEQAEISCSLLKQKFKGPLLLTHQGLSGPGILKLSAFGAKEFYHADYRFSVFINWLGGQSLNEIQQLLSQLKINNTKKAATNAKPAVFPQRLWEYFIAGAGIDTMQRWADVSNKNLNKLADLLYRQQLQVEGKNTFKEEFVTAGGVDLKEVDFKTMQSKKIPGLYFAGEVLNIDGVTGGFNFQAAWTTSWIAAQHMV
ncbi:MAG: NAD(P)/FAD-dependent oxidoreductase [Bacteroidia bacterium]|nr:NAD(P)/FAD-dependent oxidoreductase [Bacteroidia bacterium]